jgi:hypothetical protein
LRIIGAMVWGDMSTARPDSTLAGDDLAESDETLALERAHVLGLGARSDKQPNRTDDRRASREVRNCGYSTRRA